MIAALYVETGGCYFGLPGVDPWDETRDARRYTGPHPVVAHPPCQRWGKLWAGQPLFIKRTGIRKKKGDDGGCFAAALAAARKWGGVIEHPWESHAWPHFELTKPPRHGGWVKADEYGGWTCCVEQGRYGHYARKPTMLLAYHTVLPDLEWGKSEMRLDPAVVERMGMKRAKRLGEVGARGGGKDSSPRIGTPTLFRDLLIEMAMSVLERSFVGKTVLTHHLQEHTVLNNPLTKETPVSFELTIRADSPDAFAQQLIQAAFLVAPNLSERFAPPKPPAETAAPAEPEKKPRGRKAVDNVAKKETEATNEDAMADAAGADGVGDGSDAVAGAAVPTGAAGGTADGTVSEAEPAEAKAEAPESVSESEAAPVDLTIDELRAYTVRQYLNACFDKQDDRRDAFRALCQQFEVEAIGKLPADKIGEFKRVVDEKIAEYEAKEKAAMKGAK